MVVAVALRQIGWQPWQRVAAAAADDLSSQFYFLAFCSDGERGNVFRAIKEAGEFVKDETGNDKRCSFCVTAKTWHGI